MEVTAKLNYLGIAPRKVRLVADMIRGRTVLDAEQQLTFLTKRAANPLLKLLRSAEANAKHNFNIQKENLKIVKIVVDGGPVLKRSRPRAFGRAFPVRKKSSHITMVLEEFKTGALKKTARRMPKQPIMRQITDGQELKEITRDEIKAGGSSFKETRKAEPKQRSINVIRRIFQRKAI